MTSRPLFMSVAESMVTLGPIDQRGWFSASSSVTWSRSRSGCAQNGPPLAVRMRRRTLSRRSPHRHCQIALCSESTGLIPRWPAALMTSAPAMTRTSLVASATSFPAFNAARVGASARAPDIATTTRSHRGSVTICSTLASKSASPAWPWIRYSAVRLADRRPSVRPKSLSRAGLRSITSRVCCPMDPVAPRTATLMGRPRGPREVTATPLTSWGSSLKDVEHHHVEVDEDRRKQDRVEAVENAAMSRDEIGRVFDLGDALHLRLDQVAHLRAHPDEDAKGDRVNRGQADDERDADDHHDHRPDDARDRAFYGLARADRREEWVTAEAAAHQQGHRVIGHHCKNHEERPNHAMRLRCVQQQVVVERHADVEGAGEAHRPAAEALPPTRHHKKCSEAADQGQRQDKVDVDLLEHCAAEGEEGAKRKEQPAWR